MARPHVHTLIMPCWLHALPPVRMCCVRQAGQSYQQGKGEGAAASRSRGGSKPNFSE